MSLFAVLAEQRRGRRGGDEGLDLFSRTRMGLPVDESDGSINLGRLSVRSDKHSRGGMGDLLSGADMGKHDYDWLLTPPGTPLSSTLAAAENQQPSVAVAPRSKFSARSSTFKTTTSRFSVAEPEKNNFTKPIRSSSVTRSSMYSSNFSNNMSFLKTSMTSIASCRSSTPTRRLPAVSAAKQHTIAPVARPSLSRPSSPAKARTAPSIIGEKSRSLHGSRPSTPIARSHIPSNLVSSSDPNPVLARSNSRPSTPTRRTLTTSSAPVPTRPLTPTRRAPALSSAPVQSRPSSAGGLPATNIRNHNPLSRPSSPSPRVRSPVQYLVLPEFPLDTPPNLRTKLPERPASAGRTRPGTVLTVRANMNSQAPTTANAIQRPSSPAARERFSENSPKTKLQAYGHQMFSSETQKNMTVSDFMDKKIARPSTAVESTAGFGRTASRRSLDMVVRHMDTRTGGGRGASLFPQSVHSIASKGRPAHVSDSMFLGVRNGADMVDDDCFLSMSGSYNGVISENDGSITTSPYGDFLRRSATLPDVFESSRYDSVLLKEDKKNLNWLHSVDDNSDEYFLFDQRFPFEALPEPFALP